MKKLFTLFVAILLTSAAFSQTYLSEDFSGGTFPPDGWFGLPLGDVWVASNTSNAGGIAPEADFTGFMSSGSAELKSGLIDLDDADTVMLIFKHNFVKGSGSAPAIGVATRAGGDWVSVWEVTPSASIDPEEVALILTHDHVGASNFQIRFYLEGNIQNVEDWFIDDIEIFAIPGLDAKMSAIMTPAQIMSPAPVEGRVSNLGTDTITELNVAWRSYAGVVRDSTFSGLALAPQDFFDFMFDGSWASPYGTHDLTMWINSVNGVADENLMNDTLSKPIEYISYTFQNRPGIEEFTSSTCSPCASFNSSFTPWAESNADDMTLIKYQMNWPGTGDPYYTAEGGARRSYYGVQYVPEMYVNGGSANNPGGGASFPITKTLFNAALEQSIGLKIASSFTMSGSIINITTNIYPFQSFSNVRIHNVVFETMTTQNAATNGETEFHHVMMKMMPNANGELADLVEGVPLTLSYTYDMATTNVEELDDLMIGVLIQDASTKEIYQSDYGYDGVVYSDDSRLSQIYLDGVPLEGFDPDVYTYTVGLPEGTIEEPVLTVDPMDENALPAVSMAFAIPGTATIKVIAEDLVNISTYEINYDFDTGIDDEEVQPMVNVFPNPADDQIFITGLEDARVAIHSIDGKLMILKEHFSGNNINISQLPRGIYIMNIMMADKQIVRKKIAVL